MKHQTFRYSTRAELDRELAMLGVTLPLCDDMAPLARPLSLGEGKQAQNRLAIQPMEGCDGTSEGAPDTLTERRYLRFAESGGGLIWFEAVAVTPEGRANPRQLLAAPNNLDAFRRLTEQIRERAMASCGIEPVLIMQATHSGRYAKPEGKPAPIIAYANPLFEGKNPISPDRIISDNALAALEERYGEAARFAAAAGFDGIDIKACHRYLMSELLSAYNRPGQYGGCFENRTRLLRNAFAAARAAAPHQFLVTSRLGVYDGFPYPYGFGISPHGGTEPVLDEALALIGRLRAEGGLSLLDVTIGNPYVNPHVNRPYDMGGYIPDEHPLEGVARMMHCVGEVQRAYPELAVIGSGFSYLRQYAPALAAGAVSSGVCAMAGFGREAFAYPTFARDILQKSEMNPSACCITCGKCTELMRMGSVTGCIVRDREIYLPLYRQYKEQTQ